MIIKDVMEEIAEVLNGIDGLNAFGHPVSALTPPAAEVLFPDIEYDASMARGVDRMEGGIIVSVSSVTDDGARDAVSRYISGDASPHSIRHVIHQRTEAKAWKSCHFVRAIRAYGIDYTVGDTPMLAYRFDLDIAGSGGS